MNSSFKNILINSTLLFIIASMLEMTLHECGHFMAGAIVGAKNLVLYHNYVSYNSEVLSMKRSIFISGAGPIVSLIIGIVFQIICSLRKNKDLFFLFCLYMSVFGHIGFWGYIMISPFFSYGDTGYIFASLGFSSWLVWIIAFSGAVALFFIMKSLTKFFVQTGSKEIIEIQQTRDKYIKSLLLFPLFLGIIITTLLNLPVPTPLSLIAPLFSPFAIMWPYGYAVRGKYPIESLNTGFDRFNRVYPALLVFLAFIILMNRLLVLGLKWG